MNDECFLLKTGSGGYEVYNNSKTLKLIVKPTIHNGALTSFIAYLYIKEGVGWKQTGTHLFSSLYQFEELVLSTPDFSKASHELPDINRN